MFARQEHDRRVGEALALADQRGQLHAVAVGHVQVHQDQLRPELLEGVERRQRVHHRDGVHAGLAQDRLREQRLRAVVLDDHHAVGLGGVGLDQLLDARAQFAGGGRQRDEGIGAGAHHPQAHGDVGAGRHHHQRNALAGARARGAHGLADGLDLVEERGVEDHQVGGQRAQHLLELVGAFDDLELVALGLEALVEFGRERIAIAQVEDMAADTGRGGGNRRDDPRRRQRNRLGYRLRACGGGRRGFRHGLFRLERRGARVHARVEHRGLCWHLVDRTGEARHELRRRRHLQRDAIEGDALVGTGPEVGAEAGAGRGLRGRAERIEGLQDQAGGVGVGQRDRLHVRRQRTLDRVELFREVDQAVAAATAGQQLQLVVEQRQGVDVPADVAQPPSAPAHAVEALGQVAQERLAELGALLDFVHTGHGADARRLCRTIARGRRGQPCASGGQNWLTTTSTTTPTSTRAGSSLKIRSQRELRRLRPSRKAAARRMQATW